MVLRRKQRGFRPKTRVKAKRLEVSSDWVRRDDEGRCAPVHLKDRLLRLHRFPPALLPPQVWRKTALSATEIPNTRPAESLGRTRLTLLCCSRSMTPGSRTRPELFQTSTSFQMKEFASAATCYFPPPPLSLHYLAPVLPPTTTPFFFVFLPKQGGPVTGS